MLGRVLSSALDLHPPDARSVSCLVPPGGAVLTKSHRLQWLNHKTGFLIILEARSLRSRDWQGWFFSGL